MQPATSEQIDAAHPRSRGENRPVASSIEVASGSSPLTRGKPAAFWRSTSAARLIPAHAGKTKPGKDLQRYLGAHPRSRGENATSWSVVTLMNGSSPLTRGKLRVRRDPVEHARLIPAHAGKTPRPSRSASRCAAHPRSRGENGFAFDTGFEIDGSSPLTRGKPEIALDEARTEGLIPAHAGKTALDSRFHAVERAHPRSRGENGIVRMLSWSPPGSSPLTRGKPGTLERGCELVRLIPAHAGKTPQL